MFRVPARGGVELREQPQDCSCSGTANRRANSIWLSGPRPRDAAETHRQAFRAMRDALAAAWGRDWVDKGRDPKPSWKLWLTGQSMDDVVETLSALCAIFSLGATLT